MPTVLPVRWVRPSSAVLLGLGAVAAARLLTLPESFWEYDEFRFAEGVLEFDPLHHRPHPPGYPLLIGLGKLFNLVLGDPFASLVALSVVSCLIGYLALVDAFRRMAPGEPDAAERIAVTGAVLFHLSPTMLVYGPLPLSDAPTLMFLALALAAGARLGEGGSARAACALGAFASAAVGCRPQLAVAVLPMLAVALGQVPEWRKREITLAAFTLVSLLWFVPLTLETGGLSGLLGWLTRQADTVLIYDAEASRADYSVPRLIARFVAHPWGAKWTSVPLLALAALGLTMVARDRRWQAFPLFILAGVDLALGLAVMNPTDAVRYALPSEIAVAFAAGVGCVVLARMARKPAVAYAVAALLVAGFVRYAAPVLTVRSSQASPIAQAASWARETLPEGTVILAERNLNAPAAFLFAGFKVLPVEAGLERTASRGREVWLLGDGESRWPEAAAFRWPESDAYGKLTRNLYQVITLSPIPPERRYQALHGVYPFSRDPDVRGGVPRWLDAEAQVRLFRGVTETETVAVTLGLPADAPYPMAQVAIAVQGTPAATVEIPRAGTRRTLLPLPPRSSGDAVEIAFRSSASFIPSRSGRGLDDRRLAVQLFDIEQFQP